MENISIGCYISFDLVPNRKSYDTSAHLAHSSDKESKFLYSKVIRNWEKIRLK